MKTRLDRLMADRGLTESREKAQALILAGEVLIDGQKALKAGQSVAPDCRIEILNRPPYVSRGGYKLAAALDAFSIEVNGRVCADIGSSTGGFTDVLLQRGAARVYAVDSGTNQLDWKLRSDPRVVARENCNARFLTPAALGATVSLAVCDVSFISVTLLLQPMVSLLEPQDGFQPEMVILVKPQFEAGKGQVGKGGIVRDPAVREAACARVDAAVRELGFTTHIIDSPILGAEGNKEFLLYARR